MRRSNRTEIEFIEGPVDITVDPLNLLYFYPTSVASTSSCNSKKEHTLTEVEEVDGERFELLGTPPHKETPGSYFNAHSTPFKVTPTPCDVDSLPPSIKSEPASFVLAYGPSPMDHKTSGHPENMFEYRFSLRNVYLPHEDNQFIVYDPPYYPYHFLRLNTETSGSYISSLESDHIRFIVLAVSLLNTGHLALNESHRINETLFVQSWFPPDTCKHGHSVRRFPVVELLLSLTTIFVHQPHGPQAKMFRQHHPISARAIFVTPFETFTHNDSDSSIELPIYSTPSSCEWEEVSGLLSSFTESLPLVFACKTKQKTPTTNLQEPILFSKPSPNLDTTPSTQDDGDLDIYEERPPPPHTSTISLPSMSSSMLELQPLKSSTSLNEPLISKEEDTFEQMETDAQPEADATLSDDQKPSSNQTCQADPFELDPDNIWESNADNGGWNTAWDRPMPLYISNHPSEEDLFEPFKTPDPLDSGILGYGPFRNISNYTPPITLDYRIYLHPTSTHDALRHFAYGGPEFRNGDQVQLHRLHMSPYVANSSLNYVCLYGYFLHQVESYLRGDPAFINGVPIPTSLMKNPKRIPNTSDDRLKFRFPLVERFISTFTARSGHPRLAHPFGRLSLSDIKDLVSPRFPILSNPKHHILQLHPPDLSYVIAKFFAFDHRHPDDVNDNLPFPYYGCLRHFEAFLFQRNFPVYSSMLYHTAKTRPPPALGRVICWEEILDPYLFHEYFPDDSHQQVIHRASPGSSTSNVWFPHLQHLLQCVRQVNQLIRVLDTFFQTIGYEGLRDLAEIIRLNTKVDFPHNPLLNAEQAQYFTALYDFLLREHAVNLARPILHLLHLTFPDIYHLALARKAIVNVIEPPILNHSLYGDEDFDFDISSSDEA